MSEPSQEPQAPVPPQAAEAPFPQPPTQGAPAPAAARLADGEWHRLHPASPLLKGGIALLAILGIVVANLRERLIDMFLPGWTEGGGDPVDYVIDSGMIGWALLAVLVLILVLVAGFWVSWRMHTFRITDELVEVRSGIVFRTSRKARLDRIQGINIVRPFIARLFGAARLEINQAGQDANVQLSYLGSAASDELRREILRLASGIRGSDAAAGGLSRPPAAASKAEGASAAAFVGERVHELLAPELDPDLAPPESVVKLSVGRLLGSIVLSSSMIILVLVIIGAIIAGVASGAWYAILGVFPAALGIGGYLVSRFTKSLRYSIAATPDGVRVGFGLLTTSNETLPPGRIHSVQISQPLLWRPFGWWEIKVNRASQSSTKGAGGQANTTILPVGDHDDVTRVLGLLMPGLLDDERSAALITVGVSGRGAADDGYTNSPPRARVLRWFSRRRNGFAFSENAFLLRAGAVWRTLVIVPAPRVQSVSVERGPVGRMLRLASLHLHTVQGPISAALGAIDEGDAAEFFHAASAFTVDAAARDRSHRWGASSEDPVAVGDAEAGLGSGSVGATEAVDTVDAADRRTEGL